MNYYLALFSVLAALLSTTSWILIGVGSVIVVALNMIFMRWALKQLRVEPSEELDASGASNAIGDTPIRTSVGVPRNRSLRPRDPAAEGGEEVGAAAAKANADSETARQPALASFEPLIPFSPASAAGASPAPAPSKPVESQPAGSLIALTSAAPSASPVTSPSADALVLPPLQGDKSNSLEAKAAEDFAAAETVVPISSPIRPKGEASADLILVDKKSGSADAPGSAAAISGNQLSSATDSPSKTSQPEVESAFARMPLPELMPLDADQDDVKKAKSSKAPATSPEGALTASVSPTASPAENKAASSPESAEMTGLILPVLVPASASITEPVKAPVVIEPEPVSKESEPAADVLPLPPLETALSAKHETPAKPEAPAKPAPRSRIFLPADIPAAAPATAPASVAVPPEPLITPEVAPVPAAIIEPPVSAPAPVEVTNKVEDKPAEPVPTAVIEPLVSAPAPVEVTNKVEDKPAEPVSEPVPSSAPLTEIEMPGEVSQPASALPHLKEADEAVVAVRPADQEKSEAAPLSAELPVIEEAPVAIHPEDKTPEPVPTPELPPEEPKEEVESHHHEVAPTAGLVELPEDTAHLTAKSSEPSEPEAAPLVEISKPLDVHQEEPLAPASEVELAPPVVPSVTDSAKQPDESETTPQAAVPSEVVTTETAKSEESEPVASVPNPGLSPVDAQHVHGSTVETESQPQPEADLVTDDSPHDLPVQLAPVEVTPVPESPKAEVVGHAPEAVPIHEEMVASEASSTTPEVSHASEASQSGLVLLKDEPDAPAPVAEIPTTLSPQAAVAPAESSAPITTTPPRSYMTSTESTPSTPANGRASAQLTLGFEVTSLQLTPFFKLGAVQLRPLSNIVSLHLLTTQQAENPLAAGISFQIETVDLDDSAHIRSILLKPLPQSQPAATPQPKLQVDNVQLGQTTEGAPIQVTSSQGTSTAVQLLATCTIAAMDFTPAFEIGSLRLEPNSNFVLLRSAPSQRPAALDLPPSFEVAAVQLEGSAQIASVRLTPSTAK